MDAAKIGAQVHRFRDHVALYIGTGATVYLTPKDAREFARQITKAARNVRDFPKFSESPSVSKSFTFEGMK